MAISNAEYQKVFTTVATVHKTSAVVPTSEPMLPLLTHLGSLEATEWLRSSLTTFAESVSSFLPGDLPAYARIYHPFDRNGELSTWRDQLALTGKQLRDPAEAERFAYTGTPEAQARVGTLAKPLIDVLLRHLEPATTTPGDCYFAVWEGFGGSQYHTRSGQSSRCRTAPITSSADLWQAH